MSQVILVLAGLAVGILTGLVFFGGLWWTSHRLVTSRRPGLLVAASLLARFVLIATVLVLLARADVTVFVGSLVGIIVSRLALTRAAVSGRLPEPATAPNTSEERG